MLLARDHAASGGDPIQMRARQTVAVHNDRLVTALARAYHSQDLADSGRYASISDLAAALSLDRSYVSGIMRLTLLAPGLVDDRKPSGLSLERLVHGMPVIWEEQGVGLGFSGR